MVLEKILENPLDSQEVKLKASQSTKGSQHWVLFRKTDSKAEAPMLWPPDANSQLIGKELDAGEDWSQNEKRVAEEEMVR